jgi:hypothetical protein
MHSYICATWPLIAAPMRMAACEVLYACSLLAHSGSHLFSDFTSCG